jgi:soluble lytic murein transglycosylase
MLKGYFMKLLRFIVFLLVLAFCFSLWKGWQWLENESLRKSRYEVMVVRVADSMNMDPLLIRAQIWRESNFDPRAYGTAQERGLMQVTPGAARDWLDRSRVEGFQLDDLYKPDINILVGCWYLRKAMDRWSNSDNPTVFALAEYNAGITNVRRWTEGLTEPYSSEEFLANMDYPSTKEYIISILMRYEFYKHNPNITPVNELRDLYYATMHRVERKWIKKQ